MKLMIKLTVARTQVEQITVMNPVLTMYFINVVIFLSDLYFTRALAI